MDVHGLAAQLAEFLREHHADKLNARYNLEESESADADGFGILRAIAASRGMKQSGGELDAERAALALLDDFRGCKIGKITLELPPRL
jgi:ribosome biogenesis GTPase A